MTLISATDPAVASLTPLDFSDGYGRSETLQAESLALPARDAVHAAVQGQMSIPSNLIDQAMTALAAGKHLLLYGPPGTGKTTFASLLTTAYKCEAVSVTASADWTPFETAGGLQLAFEDDMETMVHQPGIITDAVVRCLNLIAEERAGQARDHQAAWLVIDEINRANMDAAFGPYFNALDSDHPRVALPFMDEGRQEIYVPSRFRVIGTMNTYDKNFLFRMSYALTRRFSLIEVGVPANDDTEAREREGHGILAAAAKKLESVGVNKTSHQLATEYEAVLLMLYGRLMTRIRSSDDEGLGRGIGFAQIASAFAQTALAVELGYVNTGDANAKQLEALDRGVLSSIVPQLEGLPSSKLKAFTDWWAADAELKQLAESLAATRALISGLDLFISEPG